MGAHGWIRAASAAALAAFTLSACGTLRVRLDPRRVTSIGLGLPAGEPTFCPGEPLPIDVWASVDGEMLCSSAAPSASCDAIGEGVIDPASIRVEGSSGRLRRADGRLFWVPDADPLLTAASGLSLLAFVEADGPGGPARSQAALLHLRPDYACLRRAVFAPSAKVEPGQRGAPGPDLDIAVTTLATPYHPDAVLVRVDAPGQPRVYLVSASPDDPVTIVSKGQAGGDGAPGPDGRDEIDWSTAAPASCAPGGVRRLHGAPGGSGGDGGDGGRIRLVLDEAAADRLALRIAVSSVGGEGGRGGRAGHGVLGSRGGCSLVDRRGDDGADGAEGRRGQDGPPPQTSFAPREDLFAEELPRIERVEAIR